MIQCGPSWDKSEEESGGIVPQAMGEIMMGNFSAPYKVWNAACEFLGTSLCSISC